MHMIDEQFTATPFYGSRKMAEHLSRELQQSINRKRIQRLMGEMGIAAVFPGPNTSRQNPQNKIYPYLLRDYRITRPNEVWSADITYVRLSHGFAHLVAIIDWYSRYVVSWSLSNTMDSDFCVAALQEALKVAQPVIFNTDQGSQFTSNDFTSVLIDKEIKISMDGRGRALDNIFIERLWRSVKYEDIYLRGYQVLAEALTGLAAYFKFYNDKRLHESLNYATPSEVHFALAA